MTENQITQLLKNAEVDLGATVEGRFSPGDWANIRSRASRDIESQLTQDPHLKPETAWQNVIRAFHQSRYWGFVPNYRPQVVKDDSKKPNRLGLWLLWMAFNAMTTMKVAVLWFGYKYSSNEDLKYKWIFFGVLAFSIGNFAYFLWRYRGQTE